MRATELMFFQPVSLLFAVKGASTMLFWSAPQSEHSGRIPAGLPAPSGVHTRVCRSLNLHCLITYSGIAVPASGNIPLFYVVERKALIIHVPIDNIIVEKINILWACQTHLSKPRVRYVASDTHDCVGSYAVFFS